jgi:hypothetical protein
MGIFGERKSDAESDIDSFLGQKILLPQTFLRANAGEEHIRIYGDSRFAFTRQTLLNESSINGEPFWHGKVFLKCRDSLDDRAVPSLVFDVMFDGKQIGLISEFDSVARNVLNFELDQKYVARAVIRADLIGNLVHLFVNPENAV